MRYTRCSGGGINESEQDERRRRRAVPEHEDPAEADRRVPLEPRQDLRADEGGGGGERCGDHRPGACGARAQETSV